MSRRGISVMIMVVVFSLLAGTLVMAYHSLWRGSSRTTFSVQELRQLTNLARSSLDEAYFALQTLLDSGQESTLAYFTLGQAVPAKTFAPIVTRENAQEMTLNAQVLEYTTSDVSLIRVKGLDFTSFDPTSPVGIIDMKVTVEVRRESPRHVASMTMCERRHVRFAADQGPFASAGKHLEMSATPIGTWIEGD